MPDRIPYNFFYMLGLAKIDFDSDVLKMALVDNTYTNNPHATTWESGSDPYDSEISAGNGYSAGGVAVTGSVSTNTSPTNNTKFDITNPTWTASGGSIGPFRYGVLYAESVSSPQNKPIIYVRDYNSDQTANDGATITDTIDSDGLFTVS